MQVVREIEIRSNKTIQLAKTGNLEAATGYRIGNIADEACIIQNQNQVLRGLHQHFSIIYSFLIRHHSRFHQMTVAVDELTKDRKHFAFLQRISRHFAGGFPKKEDSPHREGAPL